MNAKMGWLVKPSGLVEPKGLLDGQVEGADQNGVKDGGHGDDGQHGGGELAYHAEHGHLDDHEDDAGDKGGQEGCDNSDGGLDLTVLAGGVDDDVAAGQLLVVVVAVDDLGVVRDKRKGVAQVLDL